MLKIITTNDWFRIADALQDLGNHHPIFKNNEASDQLDTLTNAIKYYHNPHYDMTKANKVLDGINIEHETPLTLQNLIDGFEKLIGTW